MPATPPPRFVGKGPGRGGTAGGDAPVPDDDAAGAPKKKRLRKLLKSKKFLMVLVAVLAVGGVGFKTFAPKHVGPPTGGEVVAMEPTTLNLQGGHYLKVAISIQLIKGKGTAEAFVTSEAAQLVIDEFSNRTVDSLSSNAVRNRLRDDLRKKIKHAYPGEVFTVYLTQFVMQ